MTLQRRDDIMWQYETHETSVTLRLRDEIHETSVTLRRRDETMKPMRLCGVARDQANGLVHWILGSWIPDVAITSHGNLMAQYAWNDAKKFE